MDLKQTILHWIAKRDAAVRDVEGGVRRKELDRSSEAYVESERRLLEAVGSLSPFDSTPLSEAARLWHAAKRMSRFTEGWARHGTGPYPEIMQALGASEAVLHLLATGRPGRTHDDVQATPFPTKGRLRPDDAAFEFVDRYRDTWVVRDCEEEPGCTVIERLHRQEIERADGEESDPEPVQVVDVPPDVCGLLGQALVSRSRRVEEHKRKSELQ